MWKIQMNKKALMPAFLLFFTIAVSASAEEHIFSFYLLIEGKSAKQAQLPDYGARSLKAFPLRVKEFTFSSPYYAYEGVSFIKQAGEEVLASLPEKRRSNAVYVAAAVYSYITSTVQDAPANYLITDNFHKTYKTGLYALKDKSGNLPEKCRAAVALLRSFTIPARIVYFEGRYAVEYYLKPLKGDSVWAVMDFTEDSPEEHTRPVEWQPVTAGELLNEELNSGEAMLKTKEITEMYFIDKAEAVDFFTKIKEGAAVPANNEMPKGKFHLIRKTDYSIQTGVSVTSQAPCEIEFTMPFNDRDTFNPGAPYFRTYDFFVNPGGSALKIYYKRAHTRVNPPMDGRVYSLPVKFWTEPAQAF